MYNTVSLIALSRLEHLWTKTGSYCTKIHYVGSFAQSGGHEFVFTKSRCRQTMSVCLCPYTFGPVSLRSSCVSVLTSRVLHMSAVSCSFILFSTTTLSAPWPPDPAAGGGHIPLSSHRTLAAGGGREAGCCRGTHLISEEEEGQESVGHLTNSTQAAPGSGHQLHSSDQCLHRTRKVYA